MLEIKNLSFSYGKEKVIENFSATFKKGERVCIKGESGRGKTTLLRLVCGLEKPESGSVSFTENEKIGVVFQSDILLPWYTAFENVKLVSNEENAKKWLGAFSLENALNKYPSELSGGMRRRVALARAVAFEPDVLILDEAFKGLDEDLKNKITDIIAESFSKKLCIFTSHDGDEIKKFATRTIEL